MASISMKVYSAALKTRTNVNVIIPTLLPGINAVNERGQEFSEFYDHSGNFPVLYLLHGTYGDEGDWQRFSRIEDYARHHNLAVVMPYGENSCYRDTESGKNYEIYITQELPKIIQWMFPVSKKREDTFIGGLSMGGGGAVRLGLMHQDIYGCTIGLSSDFGGIVNQVRESEFTVWSHAFKGTSLDEKTPVDSFWLAEKAMNDSGARTKLYIGCGTEDFLYEENCRYHQFLETIGFDHVFSTKPGIHNWDFWDNEIRKVMEWLPINMEEKRLGL